MGNERLAGAQPESSRPHRHDRRLPDTRTSSDLWRLLQEKYGGPEGNPVGEQLRGVDRNMAAPMTREQLFERVDTLHRDLRPLESVQHPETPAWLTGVVHSFYQSLRWVMGRSELNTAKRHNAFNPGPRLLELGDFALHVRVLRRALKDKDARPAVLKLLHEARKLSPNLECCWLVDRTAEQYGERLGIDLLSFLRDTAQEQAPGQDRKLLLLEFGPGNGTAKREIEDAVGESYDMFALADRLYYPVETYIKQSIAFEKLPFLSAEDRDTFCTFLYMLMYCRKTAGGVEAVRDPDFVRDLQRDPGAIISYLRNVAPLLRNVTRVPRPGGAVENDGSIQAREWIEKPETAGFERAVEAFARDPLGALRIGRGKQTPFSTIPVESTAEILEDFNMITALEDGQIDVAYGVRSTVYKTGQEYLDFMQSMAYKLTREGCYIDDNVRENFGERYRIPLLRTLQTTLRRYGFKDLYIILGPGQPGEDDDRGDVPCSVVLTRSAKAVERVRKNLSAAHRLVRLDDITD